MKEAMPKASGAGLAEFGTSGKRRLFLRSERVADGVHTRNFHRRVMMEAEEVATRCTKLLAT